MVCFDPLSSTWFPALAIHLTTSTNYSSGYRVQDLLIEYQLWSLGPKVIFQFGYYKDFKLDWTGMANFVSGILIGIITEFLTNSAMIQRTFWPEKFKITKDSSEIEGRDSNFLNTLQSLGHLVSPIGIFQFWIRRLR